MPAMDESSRSLPLLMSLPSNQSFDKMDLSRAMLQQSQSHQQQQQQQQSLRSVASHTSQFPATSTLSQPRPEIILRWKRFALLVLLGAVLISSFTVTLYKGIPLTSVRPEDAEKKVALFNSYSGVVMGFAESGMSQLLEHLFPVFIVYLHNLKWSRHDDPATRPASKLKKTALLLFFPLVMIAIGNSLSAVQTNQSGGDAEAANAAAGSRRLVVDEHMWTLARPRALDATVFTAVDGVQGLDTIDVSDPGLHRVAVGTRVAVGFPLRDWRNEVEIAMAGMTEAAQTTTVVSTDTAIDLLRHGLRMLQHFAKENRVDLAIPETIQQLDNLSESATAQDLLHAARKILGSSPDRRFNTSGLTMRSSVDQLQPQIQLQSLTLQLPLISINSTVSCGRTSCVSFSTDPLVRLRPLIAASGYSPACSGGDFTACAAATDAAFLYSSSVSSHKSDGYILTLTFAKLAWSFDGVSPSLDLCSETGSPACAGLSLLLQPSRRHLVLTAPLVPSSHLNLHTSPSQPLRLVQITQPPVITQTNQLATLTLLENSHASSTGLPSIDRLASFLRTNRLTGDYLTTPSTLHATALLFLFQNALVTPPASTPHVAWQRHLQTQPTGKEYQIYIANTRFGAISTWTACAILLLLSTLVLVLPNARARLEPPKGGNARAERFVAVQTEQVYPNLVYKKRFRIGKTGEKIKFREFAVEAVTLHHKMEEDEQIQL